jgi:hypothetical protein
MEDLVAIFGKLESSTLLKVFKNYEIKAQGC